MDKFTSSGYVYGLDQNGDETTRLTPNFESDNYDDLILQINESLENGTLIKEGTLQKFLGAVMYIESTRQGEDGKTNFISNYVEFGELTESQSDVIYEQIFKEMFDDTDDPAKEVM